MKTKYVLKKIKKNEQKQKSKSDFFEIHRKRWWCWKKLVVFWKKFEKNLKKDDDFNEENSDEHKKYGGDSISKGKEKLTILYQKPFQGKN